MRWRTATNSVPIIALALSGDGKLVAASSIRGAVAIIEHASRKLERTLVGPGLPAWSVAFLPDNRTLLTGGSDRMIRRWNALDGEHQGEGPHAVLGEGEVGDVEDGEIEEEIEQSQHHRLQADDRALAGIDRRHALSLPRR